MLLVRTGIFAGFIAGLFGIGGGVVVVPALYYIYTLAEVDESIRMHLAVGTSPCKYCSNFNYIGYKSS